MRVDGKAVTGAWVLASLVVLAAIAAWASAVPGIHREHSTMPVAPDSPAPLETLSLAAAAAVIRDRDPFRLSRRPAAVLYDPDAPQGTVAQVAPPRPVRPTLALAGIVGGPPWIVLVEGVPGREGGVLLTVGRESNGVRLTAIRGDTAHLAGFDTTWTLTPKRTWP